MLPLEHPHRHQPAFTLIAVLVVIAILATIAMPAYSGMMAGSKIIQVLIEHAPNRGKQVQSNTYKR